MWKFSLFLFILPISLHAIVLAKKENKIVKIYFCIGTKSNENILEMKKKKSKTVKNFLPENNNKKEFLFLFNFLICFCLLSQARIKLWSHLARSFKSWDLLLLERKIWSFKGNCRQKSWSCHRKWNCHERKTRFIHTNS